MDKGKNLYRKILGETWTKNTMEEPATAYQAMSAGYTPVMARTNYTLSQAGLTKESLLKLKTETGFTLSEIAGYLHITPRTIQRYTEGQALSTPISERILHILEVYAKGYKVFEDTKNFQQWMATPHIMFDNQPPKSLLGSHYGITLILDELGRIEHGIFA